MIEPRDLCFFATELYTHGIEQEQAKAVYQHMVDYCIAKAKANGLSGKPFKWAENYLTNIYEKEGNHERLEIRTNKRND